MKKCGICLLLCLLTLLLPAMAWADTVYGTAKGYTPVSTGPGDQFGEMAGVYLSSGDRVLIRTKSNSGNETWLQVEFRFRGSPVRGYVRWADVNAELRRVTVEAPLCTGLIPARHSVVAAGPADQGYRVYESELRGNTSAIVWEVDDGYAHVEYWNFDKVRKWRAWIPLHELQTDWYFSPSGYYGSSHAEESLWEPQPTRSPSTYYGSTGKGYPVGKMCTVVSGSCHVKRGPGTEYQTVEYAYVGQRYEVLECRTGSTGKDWYRIHVNGASGWISSGLVSLD